MAWDSSRPVPWQRLIREWLLYVGIMVIVFLIIYRNRLEIGLFIGLLTSGPLYVLFGAVLAKFGYQRKTLRDLKNQRASAPSKATAQTSSTAAKARPAPTKRTATGPSQRSNKPHQKRR
jgi:hypothetical protein